MRRAAAMLAAAAMAWFATGSGAAAEPLGRLFFTPEQRAALERQRRSGTQEAARTDGTLTLDGIVAAAGNGVVWINRRPVRTATPGGAVRADISRRDPSRAALATAEDSPQDPPLVLRVGEAIDRATRRKTDVVPADAIRINPPAR